MAEREPPLPGNNDHSHHVLHAEPRQSQFPPPAPPPMSQQLVLTQTQNPSYATFRSGTYIVQVPKDQIYRVPPPENSYIVERHQDPSANRKRPLCCSFCCLGIIGFIVLLVITLVAVFLIMFAKADDPNFNVERVIVKTKSGRPDYDITLKAQNPNSRVAIEYKEGGGANLHFKQKTIANGKYPSLCQDSGKSKEVAIILHGSRIELPKEIEKSLNMESSQDSTNKTHRVSLSLDIDVPARMKIGTLNGRKMKFHVTCDITVDKLAKGTKVLNQECHTNRK